jgi:hypothetical protein
MNPIARLALLTLHCACEDASADAPYVFDQSKNLAQVGEHDPASSCLFVTADDTGTGRCFGSKHSLSPEPSFRSVMAVRIELGQTEPGSRRASDQAAVSLRHL